MTYQFLQIFPVELKFLHDFFIDTKKWEAFLMITSLLWMTYQFIQIFPVEFKFLHDFFIDNKKWEVFLMII